MDFVSNAEGARASGGSIRFWREGHAKAQLFQEWKERSESGSGGAASRPPPKGLAPLWTPPNVWRVSVGASKAPTPPGLQVLPNNLVDVGIEEAWNSSEWACDSSPPLLDLR